ncbi:D-amino-acid dehydrogenase [Cupriavidus sp. YR651]|uniref:NAD(P)/FAD-dependent oxidoreductase n=1 Tax=Cupriavidus sp. YR651 TaxID=1855315 RepID=UPI000889A312|nr:FAD-dependent oxidoreductase [Cupriavidus sp. YR651]SDC70547.1 D-amino-acid dehydrogenase [Cupriavidus sp. YR651]
MSHPSSSHTQPSADVIVLGAGIVGVSTALALQQRGHAVCLVDRQAPGCETSYGNAGIIQREAVQPYAFPRAWQAILRVVARQGNDVHYHLRALPALAPALARYWHASAPGRYADTVTAYSALIRHCIAEHERLIVMAGAQDLVRKTGWLEAYRGGAAFERAGRAATAVASDHELDCVLLDSAGLAAAEPALRGGLAGAIHWRDPWTVTHPGELVRRYAALFEQAGGTLCRGDATTLQASGAGWRVSTADGPVEAAQAVIALGPWAPALTRPLGYRLPLFVKRGYHRHYAAEAMPTMPLLDAENGVLLAPMQQGLRLTTGAEFAHHDAPPTPVQSVRAERLAGELVRLGAPVEPTPWMGARPCVADMRPVVGRAPRHANLWFHFGHGHQGLTLGPATARLLGELFDGEAPYVDPTPYDPRRFGG